MRVKHLELYAEYAKKYGYDIISVGDTGAVFKEYDGDGYIRVTKSYREIEKELTDIISVRGNIRS